jgi:hypothetical protein
LPVVFDVGVIKFTHNVLPQHIGGGGSGFWCESAVVDVVVAVAGTVFSPPCVGVGATMGSKAKTRTK